MNEFYKSNPDFKEFVDKYCNKHKLTPEQALEHMLVKEIGRQYEEFAKRK